MHNRVVVRGVVEVPKALLRNDEVHQITKTLQFENKFDEHVIRGYQETADTFFLPKFYFARYLLARLKQFILNKEPVGTKHNWPFVGQLRRHQSDPAPNCVSTPRLAELVLSRKGVFASAPCGSGKTCSAIYVINKLGLKAMVVVPNTNLINQWKQQLHRFLPAARVTEYSGKKKDLTGDVVIASLQLLSRGPVTAEFPLLILDEAHLAATNVFQRAMFNVNFRYSLALTATGDRLDGMGDLFRWPLASINVRLDTDQMPATVIYRPMRHDKDMAVELQQIDPIRVDQTLAMINYRNARLIQWLHGAYANGRRIMVISKSILQLRVLRETFAKLNPTAKTALFTNEVTINGKVVRELKRTKAQRQEDERYLKDPDAVKFSTVGKAGVGHDDPSIDCMILALPMQDPRQVIGRVQRVVPGKKMPIVLIPVDDLRSVRGRMLSAYHRTLEPLGDKCRLVNECPWYAKRLNGKYVRDQIKT